MFSGIAKRYDFLNHFLSFGLDRSWRRRAVGIVKDHLRSTGHVRPSILDLASGTGDLALEALSQLPDAQITAIDPVPAMLDLFRQKIEGKGTGIVIAEGDAEHLQFQDATFDAVTIGFGTRNFTNLEIAFREIYRVLKPGGIFVNLELARPRTFPMKQLYGLYSKVIPVIGKRFSRDREAYSYLPDSVQRFPEHEEIVTMLMYSGFHTSRWQGLTAGIVALHIAVK